MTEQPKYHLYAIKTADLPQNGLKAHKYSYNANGRYVLVYSDCTLVEPYRVIREDIALTADERVWLTECKRKITEAKIKQNVAYMKEHEDEYSEFLNGFAEALEKELAEESKKIGEKK